MLVGDQIGELDAITGFQRRQALVVVVVFLAARRIEALRVRGDKARLDQRRSAGTKRVCATATGRRLTRTQFHRHGIEQRLFHLTCDGRSEEHTSELQSLMRISYADSCLKKKQTK